jgi:uncharacterized protein (TIGR03437 family)
MARATLIDLGPAGDIVVVTLFGTGLRKNTDLTKVKATIGGVDAPVLFAGLQIPASLRGRRQVTITLSVDGQSGNTSTIAVRNYKLA